MKTFTLVQMTQSPWVILLFVLLVMPIAGYASGEHGHHGHGGEHHEGEDSHQDHVEMTSDIAAQAGVEVAKAGPGLIQRRIPIYGRLVTPPDRLVNVSARFPGVITALPVNTGDRVAKGDLLVTVESNQSLQRYSLRAPISGVVQSRRANVGEATTERPILTVSDSSRLWVEFKVFPTQRQEISKGQRVRIVYRGHPFSTEISSLTPSDNGQSFIIARAVVDNAQSVFMPGDLVEGQVYVERKQVPVRIETRAIQTLDGKTVVFVQEGDEYKVREVQLGFSDSKYIEVFDGLEPGESYVTQNSYLFKADIKKSGAEHNH